MAGSGSFAVQFSAQLDRTLLANVFREAGRVHIPDILEERAAAGIFQALRAEMGWNCVYNDKGNTNELPLEQWKAMPVAQREHILSQINAGATDGAQYFHLVKRARLELRAAESHALRAAMRFIDGSVFRAFMRAVTGLRSVTVADVEVTLHGPGHFRTATVDAACDDAIKGAFILNFTPRWRTDWGGLLYFHREDGHIAEGYAPKFNALDVFLPTRQSLSIVTPFADGGRYCLAGNLRAE